MLDRLRSALALGVMLVGGVAAPALAQLQTPATGGIAALDRNLQEVAESRRVLMIGAHPDDEDTQLLALLSQERGVEAAYLALNRGEGGQNVIGGELGIPLGLLRTQELASARRIDGAQQFFTRTFDFGFSKTLAETQRFWPADSVLKDVVRIIRRFRPQVIVAVFSGTPRDGHGHHQESGVVARQAFDAAGDASRFPELKTEEGLDPWTPLKFYRSTRFGSAQGSEILSVGGLDPRTGKSYFQIAMASRSQHLSQGFGLLQPIGPQRTSIRLEADHLTPSRTASDGGDKDILDGVPADTAWVAHFADSLRSVIAPERMAAVAPAIAAALPRARTDRERQGLERALAVASNVVIDAVTSDGDVVPGQMFDVEVSLYNAGTSAVTLDSVVLAVPDGWRVAADSAGTAAVAAGAMVTRRLHVTVAPDADPTQPYFLKHPMQGAMYDWTGVPPAIRGLPQAPPLVRAGVYAHVLGAAIDLTREAVYRFDDRASGEVRRPVFVVPGVDVKLSPASVLWHAGGVAERTFEVTLTNNGTTSASGKVRLETGTWPAPPAQAFQFAPDGESRIFRFVVRRPAGVTSQTVAVRAVAETDDGHRYSDGVTLVDYPHVRPTPWVRPAESEVRVAPIALPSVARVGYIRGAADRVPEALTEVGLNVDVLSSDTIARGDLSRYGVIVVGSRAYEADSALTQHNDRLLEYVKNGGLVVVEYQQYPFINGHYAPYPMTIARPHDRVTDENAPVRILQPNDPTFNRPNKINQADWDGWPQERGLYFAHTWDPAYHPLLETEDPGEDPLQGGLLVAKYGSGTYVYTGLSFNRALPAAVPGAFRLFLNLLNLKARDVP